MVLRKYLLTAFCCVAFSIAMGGNPVAVPAQPSSPEPLGFDYIEATPGITTGSILVRTNYPVTAQLNYGMNYHFIYDKKLTNTELNINSSEEHAFKVSGLKPETTYRYQLRCTDVSGNRIESNFFTFTTNRNQQQPGRKE